ncbi:MAG TPA: type VI secretion system baseplate subunit TssG, partial [Nannocystis sp.]
MAGTHRRLGPDPQVWLDRVLAAPAPYSFLAVVDLLERLFPGPAPLGSVIEPQHERIRLQHSSALMCDIGEVVSVELRGEPPQPTLTLSLLGLCGSATPLPLYMAEEADLDDEQGAAIRGLLDILHHRVLSLLVLGLRAVDLPSSLRPDGTDPWSRRVLAFLGQDESSAAQRLPRATLLRLA